jgi:hypothetical protein
VNTTPTVTFVDGRTGRMVEGSHSHRTSAVPRVGDRVQAGSVWDVFVVESVSWDFLGAHPVGPPEGNVGGAPDVTVTVYPAGYTK